MPSEQVDPRESRRSTRVPLRISIKAQSVAEPLTCEGETIIVNLHGALIFTTEKLALGTAIEIEVFLTGKCAPAKVVYVNPLQPLHCGIELAKPQNIWGISLPPDDWNDDESAV